MEVRGVILKFLCCHYKLDLLSYIFPFSQRNPTNTGFKKQKKSLSCSTNKKVY